MGETRVDLLHLLEDLRDAYPGSLEETILTEIVANALDSAASTISFTADPAAAALTVTDNGRGMRRRDLRRFHDIAATTKARGEGIGFAGVGIKLGLLLSEEVVTETRRGADHVSTTWALAQRQRAPWKWIPPAGLVSEHGTTVRLRLQNPLSPLLDAGFIESIVRLHFQPLFDPYFDAILNEHYSGVVRFVLNGRELHRRARDGGEQAPIALRLIRKRKPSAFGYLVRSPSPLAEDLQGIAVSTFGKVIKRGWDWLGVSPAKSEFVGGLIEAPALAECLTLNKADFLRTGARGATYLTYRKALQEVVGEHLARWGEIEDRSEHQRRRAARPVERDLEAVLLDLAEKFPLLTTLAERRAGGQRKLEMGGGDGGRAGAGPAVELVSEGVELPEPPANMRPSPDAPQAPPAGETTPPEAGRVAEPPAPLDLSGRRGPRRPTRLGLRIQFESRPDDPELGRLVETTVWVNAAHPAYRRAVASRSEGYHLALAVAMALASVAVEAANEHVFVTAFLARWGEAIEKQGRGRRRRT